MQAHLFELPPSDVPSAVSGYVSKLNECLLAICNVRPPNQRKSPYTGIPFLERAGRRYLKSPLGTLPESVISRAQHLEIMRFLKQEGAPFGKTRILSDLDLDSLDKSYVAYAEEMKRYRRRVPISFDDRDNAEIVQNAIQRFGLRCRDLSDREAFSALVRTSCFDRRASGDIKGAARLSRAFMVTLWPQKVASKSASGAIQSAIRDSDRCFYFALAAFNLGWTSFQGGLASLERVAIQGLHLAHRETKDPAMWDRILVHEGYHKKYSDARFRILKNQDVSAQSPMHALYFKPGGEVHFNAALSAVEQGCELGQVSEKLGGLSPFSAFTSGIRMDTELGNVEGAIFGLSHLASSLSGEGSFEEAEAYFEQAESASRNARNLKTVTSRLHFKKYEHFLARYKQSKHTSFLEYADRERARFSESHLTRRQAERFRLMGMGAAL